MVLDFTRHIGNLFEFKLFSCEISHVKFMRGTIAC